MFKNLFKKKRKTIKVTDENYIRTKTIYNNGDDNLILLISFTNNYLYQVVEFLTTANELCTKFVDTNLLKEDEDENSRLVNIIHDRYYLLIGGNSEAYKTLFTKTNNLSNEILDAIIPELYDNFTSYSFNELIEDGILSPLFMDYEKHSKLLTFFYGDHTIKIDDINSIVKNLPSCFSAAELLKYIKVYDFTAANTLIELLQVIEDEGEKTIQYFESTGFPELFKKILRNPTMEDILMLKEPLYKIDLDDEYVFGDLPEYELDDIFKKEYERFSGIISDNIEYVDIDEVLPDNYEE